MSCVSQDSTLTIYTFCISILSGLQISGDTALKIKKPESLSAQGFQAQNASNGFEQ